MFVLWAYSGKNHMPGFGRHAKPGVGNLMPHHTACKAASAKLIWPVVVQIKIWLSQKGATVLQAQTVQLIAKHSHRAKGRTNQLHVCPKSCFALALQANWILCNKVQDCLLQLILLSFIAATNTP